jgi:hypothetical protein
MRRAIPHQQNGSNMRILIATLAILTIGSVADTAQADPYKWCAVYSGGDTGGGGSSCYFWTIEQCMASVSGVGGFCAVNTFYNGLPVRTPEDSRGPARRTKSTR